MLLQPVIQSHVLVFLLVQSYLHLLLGDGVAVESVDSSQLNCSLTVLYRSPLLSHS